MYENEISQTIIGAAIKIHRTLGPGLLESAYEMALAYDLSEMGLSVCRQVPIPLVYKDIDLEIGYRIDLLVEDCVLVELKSVERLTALHSAQTLTYLKLSDCKLALLMDCSVTHRGSTQRFHAEFAKGDAEHAEIFIVFCIKLFSAPFA